jgi:membrane protein implicated in regulation of membrane protease activity
MQDRENKKSMRAFWPLLGFILIVALGIIAYVLGEPIYNALAAGPNFPPAGGTRTQWLWILRGIAFVSLGLLSALIVAAAMPRQKTQVKEKDLAKERVQLNRERKAKRELQRKINKQMKG